MVAGMRGSHISTLPCSHISINSILYIYKKLVIDRIEEIDKIDL